MTPEEHLNAMEKANKDDLLIVSLVVAGVGLVLLLTYIVFT